jgi:cobalamin biosynthesis protein CobT
MSTYQADWFVDEDGQWSSGGEDGDSGSEGRDDSTEDDDGEESEADEADAADDQEKMVDFAHLSREEEMEYANLGTAGTDEAASNMVRPRYTSMGCTIHYLTCILNSNLLYL